MFKKILALIAVAFVVFGSCVTASAAEGTICNVDYGNASGFLFNPASTDLFQNFKGMMPGDEKTQSIIIQNTCADRTITMYISEEIKDEYKDLLDHMHIKFDIIQNGASKTLADVRASDDSQLKDVVIGTFQPREKGELKVTLSVDPLTGNKYQNASGWITLIFKVIEDEVKPTEPTTEKPTEKPTERPTTPGPVITEVPQNPKPSEVPRTRTPQGNTYRPTERPTTEPEGTTAPVRYIPGTEIPFTGSNDRAATVFCFVIMIASGVVLYCLIKKRQELNKEIYKNKEE